MSTTDELPVPDVKTVALDVTQHWQNDLAEKAGRIYQIYLYDDNRKVHLCSFRASYELWWADVYPKNRLSARDMQELRGAAMRTDVQYVSCVDVDNMKALSFPDDMYYDARVKDFGKPPEDVWRSQVEEKGGEKAHQDHMLHCTEAYHENPVFC
jgi:hypothetical protein